MGDYERIAQAIEYLEKRVEDQPSLGELAQAAGLSEFHFQRMFTRWAGISPKRFLQYCTAGYARSLLGSSGKLLDTAYEAGLSGPGRLHDLFVTVYAATPAQVRDAGAGLEIRYGFADTPFGECLVGQTARGICALSFHDEGGRSQAVEDLRSRWPGASLVQEDSGALDIAQRIFEAAGSAQSQPLTVHLQGSNFQIRVWEALLRIPTGAVTSYQEVARALGEPAATRAVGTAIGRNPVAYLIPCHRVLRSTGALGGYRWGLTRKRAMLGWEAAREHPEAGETALSI